MYAKRTAGETPERGGIFGCRTQISNVSNVTLLYINIIDCVSSRRDQRERNVPRSQSATLLLVLPTCAWDRDVLRCVHGLTRGTRTILRPPLFLKEARTVLGVATRADVLGWPCRLPEEHEWRGNAAPARTRSLLVLSGLVEVKAAHAGRSPR